MHPELWAQNGGLTRQWRASVPPEGCPEHQQVARRGGEAKTTSGTGEESAVEADDCPSVGTYLQVMKSMDDIRGERMPSGGTGVPAGDVAGLNRRAA